VEKYAQPNSPKSSSGVLQALVTKPLLNEIARTFTYPKLQGKIQQLHETPDSLLLVVQELTQPCVPVRLVEPGLRDLENSMVLEAAVGGEAVGIVTGDRDLLVLVEFSGIPILSPQDFLQIYFPQEEEI
jgi:uncharacterized protein